MPRISLHTRFANFAAWTRPETEKVEEVRKQRDEVRDRIKGKAVADGLIVRSTPGSGSFATSTGLRRHMLGGAEHEGQDVDCPFVLSGKDQDGDPLNELLGRFEGYAKASYPDTPRVRTKSSVRLEFVAAKRNIDLVPMLAVAGSDEEQVLLRAGGDKRRTSVQRHIEFVKSRTTKSQALRGPVAFNDAVRVMKWWREYRVSQSTLIDEVPTFLMLLLCSKAFDEASVQAEWPKTLQNWFDKVHSYAANRSDVTFRDFAAPQPMTAIWKVIDPVNGGNNVVPTSWSGIKIDEFRDWAKDARDKIQQAIVYDLRERDAEALALMAEVFGPSFKNHSES